MTVGLLTTSLLLVALVVLRLNFLFIGVLAFIADRFGILYSLYFLASTIFAANFLVYLIPDKPLKEKVALVAQA